jgi:hypothetical protein
MSPTATSIITTQMRYFAKPGDRGHGRANVLTPPLLLVGALGVPDAMPQRRAYAGCHGVAPP